MARKNQGMATKSGAQALETGRRKQVFKTAKAASSKAVQRVAREKAKHKRKPGSVSVAEAKTAVKEMKDAMKRMSIALKQSKKIPFE